MTSEPPEAIKIFYCYAREDKDLREELERHLSAMKRIRKITTWYDREILPGTNWKREIDQHLKTSAIILLLVSHHFMHSDYCYGIEMRQALERHKAGEAIVIPIILSPTDWQETPIGELQALPTDGKAITTWRNRNEAFVNVVSGIRMVVEALLTPPPESSGGLINHVLVLSEESALGRSLVARIKQNFTALNVTCTYQKLIAPNATWINTTKTAIDEAQNEFKYDTVFVDVRKDWKQKRQFIFMIRRRYPLVPFVLVGSREAFLSQLEVQDRHYFSHYYFFDIETPPHKVPALITQLLTQSAWYYQSHQGEKYHTEKLYNVNPTEYQVQTSPLQDE